MSAIEETWVKMHFNVEMEGFTPLPIVWMLVKRSTAQNMIKQLELLF